MKSAVKITWLISSLLFVFIFYSHTSELPSRFASHWGLDGQPNGWSTKTGFIFGLSGMFFLTNILMAAIYLLISRVPKSAVNLPNKEWWFATPERKQVVYEKVRGMMASTGVFTNTVFLFTAYVVFQNAGIALPIRIPILEGVGCILLLTVVFLIFLAKNVSAFKRTN